MSESRANRHWHFVSGLARWPGSHNHNIVEEGRSKKRRREPPSVISQRAAVTALSGQAEAEIMSNPEKKRLIDGEWAWAGRDRRQLPSQIRPPGRDRVTRQIQYLPRSQFKYSFQTPLTAYLIPPIHPWVPCVPSGGVSVARSGQGVFRGERGERLLGWEKITLVNVFIADHHSEAEILLKIHLSLNHSQT